MGKVITHNKQSLIKGSKTLLNQLGKKHSIYKNDRQTEIFSLASALHLWNFQNATNVLTTTTAVDTGSVGGLNMINPNAASEPNLTGSYLIFNGTTHGVKHDTSSFRNSDTSGVFHFKFYRTAGVVQILWQAANSAVDNEFINVSILSTGEVNFTIRVGGTFLSLISNASLVDNSINTVSIYSTGADAFMIFNGTKITSFSGDSLTSYWLKRFFDIGGTLSNISIGARYSNTIIYADQKHKIAGYSAYTSEANALADHNLIRTTTF
jgi:hypothetical protein